MQTQLLSNEKKVEAKIEEERDKELEVWNLE